MVNIEISKRCEKLCKFSNEKKKTVYWELQQNNNIKNDVVKINYRQISIKNTP